MSADMHSIRCGLCWRHSLCQSAFVLYLITATTALDKALCAVRLAADFALLALAAWVISYVFSNSELERNLF